MIRMITGVFLTVLTLNFAPVNAQESTVTCTSTPISSPVKDEWIVSSGIHTAADGQVVYLTASFEGNKVTVFHVTADDTVTEVGQIEDVLGNLSFPRWDVDTEAGNVIFTSYVDGIYTRPATVMLMDLPTGEVTPLMTGVNEYDFGRVAGRIWWGSNVDREDDPDHDYGFYLYDATTETMSAMLVPTVADSWAFTATLIRLLPDGDVLFTVGRFLDGGNDLLTAYYRGNPQTGVSQLLHQEVSVSNEFSYAGSMTLLDDRIAYINDMGEYSEIDFEGNLLRTVPLVGAGFYRDLIPTPSGVLFSYFDPDDRDIQGLYHISTADTLSALMPDGYNFRRIPPEITLITTADGVTTVWFSAERFNQADRHNLYVYSLPADDTVALSEPILIVNGAGEFYSTPDGDYIVVEDTDSSALLIDTTTFEQTETGAEYYNRVVFFDAGQPHVFDQGYLRFVDTDQDIVYYSATRLPEEGEYDDFVLYATSYDGSDPVRVSLPDVMVPFSLHSNSFIQAPDGSVIYVGYTDEEQVLYRARCQHTD